ncbi:MAG TPA: STT3 domain-containing protein [Methanotrichaceae archaeon]|nr:STT3 domain-containing protein [Methanotrichaceae archaeon]
MLSSAHRVKWILLCFLIALVVRLSQARMALADGSVLCYGMDSYYHLRRIMYGAHSFPSILWFDSYLDFPKGSQITWPPLYDFLGSLYVLILGGGSISGREVAAAALSPLLGALAVVVLYLLAEDLFNRRTAIVSALIASIAPYNLISSSFASVDHHVLEGLLLVSLVLLMSRAVFRSDIRYSLAAGAVMGLMAYGWLGSGIYFMMLALYALVQISVDRRAGSIQSDRQILLMLPFPIALVLMLPQWNQPWMSPSVLLLVLSGLVVAAAIGISRLVRKSEHWYRIPLGLVAGVLVFLVASSLLASSYPELGSMLGLIGHGFGYLVGGDLTGMVQEAYPLFMIMELTSSLGLTFLLSFLALAMITVQTLRRGADPKRLLFLVWTFFVLMLTLSQFRFIYLYTFNISVLFALLYRQARLMTEGRQMNPQQSRLISAAFLLVILLPTLSMSWGYLNFPPQPADGDWPVSMKRLSAISEPTSYFDHPNSTPEYGVVSAWDYGNWILYMAKRPVVANNFQVGVQDSTRLLLAEKESEWSSLMDKRKARYVATDWDIIYKKLGSLCQWVGEDISTYMQFSRQGDAITLKPTDRLKRTLIARLHLTDGQGLGRFRLVYESPSIRGTSPPTSQVKIFEYLPGALITGAAPEGESVSARIELLTNQGRRFTYNGTATSRHGIYEIRVPYSAGKQGDVKALGNYTIQAGAVRKTVMVSERDVLEGRKVLV